MKASGFPLCAANAETWASFIRRMEHFIKGDIPQALAHCEWSGRVEGFSPEDKPGQFQEHWRDCSLVAFVRQGCECPIVSLAVVDHYCRWLLPVWQAKCASPPVSQFMLSRLAAWAACNGFELPDWAGVVLE